MRHGALPRRTTAGATIALVAGALAFTLLAPLGGEAAGSSSPQAWRLTGTLTRVVPDRFGAAAAGEGDQSLDFVVTPVGAVPVQAGALATLPVGSAVAVDLPAASSPQAAIASLGTPVPAESTTVVQAASAVAKPSVGTVVHRVLTVVADLPGQKRSPVSAAQVAAAVNGGVDRYWSTVTGGRVRFHADPYAGSADGHVAVTTPPCTKGTAGTTYDFWDQIAKATGFTDAPGEHLVVYFPTYAPCNGLAGIATIGGTDTQGDLGGGGRVWSNGYLTTGVLGHELGHNLGLGHSQELRCGSAVDAALAKCDTLAYNDLTDIMGVSWANTGFLNAAHLEQLGLLPGTDVLPVTANRTVTLRPISTGAGVRVASITVGGSTYLVEARAKVGTDRWLGTKYGRPGVQVRKVTAPSAMSAAARQAHPSRDSYLLDGDPASDDRLTDPAAYRTVLPVGRWVPLAGGKVTLKVLSVDKSGAVVRVSYDRLAAGRKAKARVRAGSLKTTGRLLTVPTRWTWAVSDGAQVVTGSAPAVVAASARGWHRTRYEKAVRVDGKTVRVRGKARTRYVPESRASYAGRWREGPAPEAVGGREAVARRTGSSATLRVRGSSVGLVARTAPHSGRLAVYVDGRRAAVVRLSGRAGAASVLWSTTFASPGKHLVQVVALGGRRVAFDGLLVLR